MKTYVFLLFFARSLGLSILTFDKKSGFFKPYANRNLVFSVFVLLLIQIIIWVSVFDDFHFTSTSVNSHSIVLRVGDTFIKFNWSLTNSIIAVNLWEKRKYIEKNFNAMVMLERCLIIDPWMKKQVQRLVWFYEGSSLFIMIYYVVIFFIMLFTVSNPKIMDLPMWIFELAAFILQTVLVAITVLLEAAAISHLLYMIRLVKRNIKRTIIDRRCHMIPGLLNVYSKLFSIARSFENVFGKGHVVKYSWLFITLSYSTYFGLQTFESRKQTKATTLYVIYMFWAMPFVHVLYTFYEYSQLMNQVRVK